MARQEQITQQASFRQVTAVALTVSAPGTGAGYLASKAQARWRAPDGHFSTAPLLDSQVSGCAPPGRLHLRRSRARPHPALTAGELMTSPAITIGPHVTVHAAGRLMSSRHVRLLPVVDEHDRLIGVVSRRDLLAVFLRPDEDIAADVRQVLDEILLAEPGGGGRCRAGRDRDPYRGPGPPPRP